MKVGAFELDEPLPDLENAHALAMLSPWIDIGRVGSGALSALETHFGARTLGKLETPGNFFDFTRYRPTVYRKGGGREVKIPNTFVNYARRESGNDLIFLHCLEPHMFGEMYVDSVLKLLEKLEVKRYCLVGSMYDSVPHTRPLMVSGTASGGVVAEELAKLNLSSRGYEGPTTINILISEQAPKLGIETVGLIVHLPYYAHLDEDYSGQYRLLELLNQLYDFSLDLSEIKGKGEGQYRKLGQAMETDAQLREIVRMLEMSYEARSAERHDADTGPRLSPDIEKFLREINRDFGSG
jgi:predicted ATP-grasp superfamily ATP-dependent carboligase